MEIFSAVLLLLVLIGLSKIINKFVPFVPVPLIQIGLGGLAAAVPWGVHLTLEPELFFILFIAPLLYNDGRRTPREELWNVRAQILLLALGLVFATVAVAGYAIHWMIPSIPLAASFALAAILSPTDAVAVSALSGRVQLSRNTQRILEGESLMNDASGLVAFKFAVAAAVTGVFSLSQAALSFVLIAAGGLLGGALLSFVLIRLSLFLRRWGMEDVTVHVLLQILTPFLIYLVCEELGVSGILGVVAGGIVQAIEKDRAAPQYKLQLVSASIWSMLLFILNGMVFLLLGLSIPEVASVIFQDAGIDNATVILYVLAITALLIVLRFLWVYAFAAFNARFRNSGRTPLKTLLLISVSGVRGAVTLAGAFSIPLVLSDGSPFPERDLIIFLAAGVILATLVLASILLPAMAPKEELLPAESEQTVKAKVMQNCMNILGEKAAAAGAALPALSGMTGLLQAAGNGLSEPSPEEERHRRLTLKARLTGLRAERGKLASLMEEGAVTPEAGQAMLELLDRKESFLARSADTSLRLSLGELGRLFTAPFAKPLPGGGPVLQPDECIRNARIEMCRAAVEAVREEETAGNREENERVAERYGLMIDRLERLPDGSAEALAEGRRLSDKLEAFQEQRDNVQRMFEDGALSFRAAAGLRRFMDQLELSIWED